MATRKVLVNGQTVNIPENLTQADAIRALSRSYPNVANGTVKVNDDGSWTIEPKPGDKGVCA
jgi:sulfur carrier protein ThiS